MSFNDTSFMDFFSVVYGETPPENKYQISIPFKSHKSSDINTLPSSYVGAEVAEKFFEDITSKFTLPSEICNYLNYHYLAYGGVKSDFVDFIEWTIPIIKRNFNQRDPEQMDEEDRQYIHTDDNGNLIYEPRRWDEEGNEDLDAEFTPIKNKVLEWVEGKKEELKVLPLNKNDNKRPTPASNEFNKCILSQKQTAILFKLFKDHKLFTVESLNKNRYEDLLGQLTGYSKNTFHQVYSTKDSDLLSISDNPHDYERIVSELQKIIKELEETIPK